MDKKTFYSKWYGRILLVIFWCSLAFLIYIGIWAVLYEDDMPMAGIVWIIIFIILFWSMKRIFHRIMFKERVLPRTS